MLWDSLPVISSRRIRDASELIIVRGRRAPQISARGGQLRSRLLVLTVGGSHEQCSLNSGLCALSLITTLGWRSVLRVPHPPTPLPLPRTRAS